MHRRCVWLTAASALFAVALAIVPPEPALRVIRFALLTVVAAGVLMLAAFAAWNRRNR